VAPVPTQAAVRWPSAPVPTQAAVRLIQRRIRKIWMRIVLVWKSLLPAWKSRSEIITINASLVYMARYEMVLRRARSKSHIK
jgi:hypothetical protein